MSVFVNHSWYSYTCVMVRVCKKLVSWKYLCCAHLCNLCTAICVICGLERRK
jgi:hypothetical protein